MTVMQEPIEVSEEQVEALYHMNARPIQLINGRMIELHEEEFYLKFRAIATVLRKSDRPIT